LSDESVVDEEELEAEIEQARALWTAGYWREARARLMTLRNMRGDRPLLLAALGDCAAAGHRWREAVQWYEQALAARYEPSLAERLEEARSQLHQRPRMPPARALIVAAVVIVVMAMAIGGYALLSLRRPAPTSSTRAAGQPVRTLPMPTTRGRQPYATGSGVPAATSVPPAPGPALRQQQPRPGTRLSPSQAQAKTTPGLPPVHITKMVEAPATDEDHYLTELLGALNWPDGTPLNSEAVVQFDPYTGYAFVTLSLPRSLPSTNLVNTVLDASYAAAVALVKGLSTVRFVTVRVLYTVAQPDRKARTVVAFRGNTSRDAVQYWERLHRRPNYEEIWYEAFGSCWWNPQVPTGTGGPPTR